MATNLIVGFPALLYDVEANLYNQSTSLTGWLPALPHIVENQRLGYQVSVEDATLASADRIVWRSLSAQIAVTDSVDALIPTPAQNADAVRTNLAIELGRIDQNISAAKTLTGPERTAIAQAVQAGILDEGDGQLILNAIVGAIGNTNLSQVAVVAAVRADLERAGGNLANLLTSVAAVPTAAQNATAVRTNLATELARIDANVSADSAGVGTLLSRLTAARAGYLDTLNGLVAAIWNAATRRLTNLDDVRAAKIDYLTSNIAQQDTLVSAKTTLDKIAIGAIRVTVQNPVAASGELRVVRGGDYRIADGRQLKFTLEGALYLALLPNLTQIKLIVDKINVLSVAATTMTALADSVLVQVELTKAQTRAFKFDRATYYLEAITNAGAELPLTSGAIIVADGGE